MAKGRDPTCYHSISALERELRYLRRLVHRLESTGRHGVKKDEAPKYSSLKARLAFHRSAADDFDRRCAIAAEIFGSKPDIKIEP